MPSQREEFIDDMARWIAMSLHEMWEKEKGMSTNEIKL